MKGEQEDSGIGVATRMDGRTDPKICLGARHKGVKENPVLHSILQTYDPPVKKDGMRGGPVRTLAYDPVKLGSDETYDRWANAVAGRGTWASKRMAV